MFRNIFIDGNIHDAPRIAKLDHPEKNFLGESERSQSMDIASVKQLIRCRIRGRALRSSVAMSETIDVAYANKQVEAEKYAGRVTRGPHSHDSHNRASL